MNSTQYLAEYRIFVASLIKSICELDTSEYTETNCKQATIFTSLWFYVLEEQKNSKKTCNQNQYVNMGLKKDEMSKWNDPNKNNKPRKTIYQSLFLNILEYKYNITII